MGWWRSLLPCCGLGSTTPRNATFSCFCCSCCHGKGGMHDESLDLPTPEDVEKTFVFLEDYPTEGKVLNPLVPFLGELPVALYPGRVILIEGVVKPFAIRMSVNLACGSGSNADLAFHLNPRFEQNLVVRNCRLENRWREEETSSARKFPFKRGHQFQIQIFASEEEFLVAFDGDHFCAYSYRVPLLRIQMIQVNGDVDVSSLEYRKADYYPLPYEGVIRPQYNINSLRSLSDATKKLVDTPFTGQLIEGLPPGSEIEILGRVKLLPHSFYINLQEGTYVWPHPIIPLHINPRFSPGSKGGVVMNAWVKGKWGTEDKTGIHQFRPGRHFSVRIACEEDKYAVSIDGAAPLYMSHRAPPKVVTAIYIHGDVWLSDLCYRRSVKHVPS